MAEEIEAGLAYLRALRQSSDRSGAENQEIVPSGTPPETAPDPSTVGERFQGTEKRRAPRYKCEGSVEIREDEKDVHTWATFRDISLHGCYVEAQATYPAGTVLHMKLEANGVRCETQGRVRVNYPYLGMGIAFTGMSDENQEQLRRLVADASHPHPIVGPGVAPSPSTAPLEAIPAVVNPEATMRDLIKFFESQKMLMRDDFFRLLRESQRK